MAEPSTSAPPPRFGESDLELFAVIPATLATTNLLASASAALSDLQVDPFRASPWLVGWPLLLVAAAATACGHAKGRLVVMAWTLGAALLRLAERDWVGVALHVGLAWYLSRAHPGPRPGGLRRLRWVAAGVAFAALDLTFQTAAGELRSRAPTDLPRVAQVHAALPSGDEAWSGKGVRLVARPGEERLVLEGATWVLGREVSLHPTRGALTIGDALFVARDAGGEQGAITFARRHGRVRGTVELRRAQDEVRIVARLKVDYRGVRREVVLRPGR